jgi:hypothetical protein
MAREIAQFGIRVQAACEAKIRDLCDAGRGPTTSVRDQQAKAEWTESLIAHSRSQFAAQDAADRVKRNPRLFLDNYDQAGHYVPPH